MSESDAALIYVTAPDKEAARRLADALLERRLIACANLFPGMESHYRWQGKHETAQEVAMILKTRASLAEKAVAEAVRLHPYECPAVLVVPVAGGHEGFLRWILSQTAETA